MPSILNCRITTLRSPPLFMTLFPIGVPCCVGDKESKIELRKDYDPATRSVVQQESMTCHQLS